MQHAMCMRHIAICGLPRSTIFFHIISSTAQYSEKKKVIGHEMFFRFSRQLLSGTFFILRRNEEDMISIGIHVKYPVILVQF